MTEQELREKIAKETAKIYRQHFPHCPNSEVPINFGYEVATQILALIKEANYVRLADDQSLPSSPYHYYSKHTRAPQEERDSYCEIGYSRATEDMLKARFRKVD